MQKHETENISYQCSKMPATVELNFINKSTYTDGSSVPVRKLLLKKDCTDRLRCGITPKLSATLFGPTDWDLCEYLRQQAGENSEEKKQIYQMIFKIINQKVSINF